MKIKLKSLFLAIGYVLLAGVIQLAGGIVLGLGIGIYSLWTKAALNQEQVTEYIMGGLPYMLIVTSVFTVFLLYIIYLGKNKRLFKEILLKPTISKYSIIAIGIGISIWCANCSIISSISNTGLFKEMFELFSNESKALFNSHILLIILVIGVISPIGEEVLFRGVIYQTLNKSFSTGVAIVIQAVLFGLFHINPIQIIYATLFGIVVGYVVYRTQSLWTAIIIHIVNNIMAVVISKVFGETMTGVGIEIIFVVGLVGMVLFIPLMIKCTTVPVKELLENNLTAEV